MLSTFVLHTSSSSCALMRKSWFLIAVKSIMLWALRKISNMRSSARTQEQAHDGIRGVVHHCSSSYRNGLTIECLLSTQLILSRFLSQSSYERENSSDAIVKSSETCELVRFLFTLDCHWSSISPSNFDDHSFFCSLLNALVISLIAHYRLVWHDRLLKVIDFSLSWSVFFISQHDKFSLLT